MIGKPLYRYRMKYTPVFTANRLAYEHGFRYIDNQGSSRSSKTFSIMQLLCKLGSELIPGMISIVSHSLPHLKKGAMRDFNSIMKGIPDEQDTSLIWGMGIYDKDKHNKTDNVYNFGPHTAMEFFGAENEEKVRGPGRRILFINEANLLSFETFTQLAMRTTGAIFIDYNPADQHSWVYDIVGRKRATKIHSTYKNNRGNLSEWQVDEIEGLQLADENLWKVFGLGLRGASTEAIYTHYLICDTFPAECDSVVYGLDFGFNHPSAMVKIGIKDGRVYVEEVLYESKLTNDDLAYLVKTLVGINSKSAIYCDHARPEAIEDLLRAGLLALPADKAVSEGIKAVKSRPLYITRNSTNLLKEIRSYKWQLGKDPNGNKIILDEPVKFLDDGMDALRYGIYTPLNQNFGNVIFAQ